MKLLNNAFKLFIAILPLILVIKIVNAQSAVCEADTCEVQNITFISEGIRAEWSPDGEQITFHKVGEDNYYDAYIMNADGTEERCITCNKPELSNKHIGEPSLHPSKQYIVFHAQKPNHYTYPGADALAHPGIGFNHDIWLANYEGTKFWQLTNLSTKMTAEDPAPITGLLQPKFSHKGDKLVWAERIGPGGLWGEWAIKIADFVFINNEPSLQNIKTFQPGARKQYFEVNDFTLNDEFLTICGNLEIGQLEHGLDLYLLNMNDYSTKRLTHTNDVFDESAHFSPSEDKIVWLSMQNYENDRQGFFWWEWGRTDLWIGNLKGTTKKQITFFNTADTAHAELVNNQQTIITYVDWHPTDESKILASLSIQKGNGTKEEKIALVTLGSKSECKLGDVNCDSQINLLDIIKLITMVF